MFESTVRQGIRFASWKTVPMLLPGLSTRWPLRRISPPEGACRPGIKVSSVLLPQPLGPHRETKLRFSICRFTRSRATTARFPKPKRLLTLVISICAIMVQPVRPPASKTRHDRALGSGRDMLGVELEIAALHPWGGRDIGLAALRELDLRHQELELARCKVDLDLIAIADETNDATARGFRGH